VGLGLGGAALARPLLAGVLALRPGTGAGGGAAEATVLPLAVDYVAVFGVGLATVALADALEGVYLGWGDSRAALYMNVGAVGLNVVLDPLLIFGYGPVPRLGVGGAAVATVAGYTVGSLLVGLAFVARGRTGGVLRLPGAAAGAPDRWPSLADVRAVLSTGLPIGGRETVRQALRLAMVALAAVAGGPAALAAYLIGARVATVAFVPAQGLQQAAQSVAGQNVGAGKPGRARRTIRLGTGMIAAILAVVGVVQWLVPGSIVRAVAPAATPPAVGLSVDYLRILAYGYPALGAVYLLEAGFNAVDRTRVAAATTLLQYGLVRVPFAAVGVITLGWGPAAVFWAVTVSNAVAAVGLGVYYARSAASGMVERAAAGTPAEAD
jgi:Na+-driven multidrug efflux pump